MKLQELAAPSPSRQIAKVFESYFGKRISFESLSRTQTIGLLRRVRGLLSEHRMTTSRHHSEKNPTYLKLMMMEQALHGKLKEMDTTTATGATTSAAGTSVDPKTAAAKIKDPKLSAALKKTAAGQSLNPDEQKMVAGAAMMQAKESRYRRGRRLNESEVQQAQVVMAAQDMVDRMQKMLEDTTEMQFKELPSLVDSIKNQVGMDQAAQFNTDAQSALSGLVQNLQAAKQQLETALGVVTGQAPSMPPGGAPAQGMAPADDLEAGAEADADLDDLDSIAADAGADLDQPSGPDLGRARR